MVDLIILLQPAKTKAKTVYMPGSHKDPGELKFLAAFPPQKRKGMQEDEMGE